MPLNFLGDLENLPPYVLFSPYLAHVLSQPQYCQVLTPMEVRGFPGPPSLSSICNSFILLSAALWRSDKKRKREGSLSFPVFPPILSLFCLADRAAGSALQVTPGTSLPAGGSLHPVPRLRYIMLPSPAKCRPPHSLNT